MLRFALRPKWLVSHLLVLAVVVAMVNLGLWQLRRLDEKRDVNRLREERMAAPVVPVEDAVPPTVPPAAESVESEAAEAADYRRVTARGTYVPDSQVLVRGRSLEGAPGSWVVAALALADGRVVAVNRGWLNNDGRFTSVPAAYAPPTGDVQVEGVLRASEERGRFGSEDPVRGNLDSLARLDLARLDRQVEGDVLPLWIQAAVEEPTPSVHPRLLDPPSTGDEGPHLSYALQWFAFSVIAMVAYGALFVRSARRARSDG